MKMRSVVAVGCAMALIGACGGTSADKIGDPVGSSDGGVDGRADADAGENDAGTDGGPSGKSCDELLADLGRLRDAAKECCPTCDSLQCQNLKPDVCCPFTVSNPESEAGKEFDATRAAFVAKKCQIACPAVVCHQEPSRVCDPKTSRCQ